MPPRKNKKKPSAVYKSTSEDDLSGKKPLKSEKITGLASESPSEEVVSDKKVTDEKGDGDAKESVPTPKVKKPCTWLKLDRLNPPIGSQSSPESSKQGKQTKLTSQVHASNDNKRKRGEKGEEKGHDNPIHGRKIDSCAGKREQVILNDRHEDTKGADESEKILGGLIFMCNAKTKPDCFRYQLMGVPASKKEVVMNIKPGLTVFLYDYDLKLLYGVFKTSSAGGMKLEPTAFGGAFPAQVRFIVHMDCFPLPESVFKKAIKDSYDERTRKFKTELTVKQVKNLIDLYSPTPRLHPNGKSMVEQSTFCPAPPVLSEEYFTRQRYRDNSDPRGKSIPLHHDNQLPYFRNPVPPQDPLFLTEQEYRNNGLQQARPLLPTTIGDTVSHIRKPNKLDVELKQLIRKPALTTIDPAVQQREVSQPDPFFLNEKEYRTRGLRGPQHIPNGAAPPMMTSDSNAYDPYDESTTSLVNRYLAMPMTMAIPAEPYPLHPARTNPEGERAFASYNMPEQSIISQRSYSLNATQEPSVFDRGTSLPRGTDLTSAPVSNRYSFAGPSVSLHR